MPLAESQAAVTLQRIEVGIPTVETIFLKPGLLSSKRESGLKRKIEHRARTEADGNLQPILTKSASIAEDLLLYAAYHAIHFSALICFSPFESIISNV